MMALLRGPRQLYSLYNTETQESAPIVESSVREEELQPCEQAAVRHPSPPGLYPTSSYTDASSTIIIRAAASHRCF